MRFGIEGVLDDFLLDLGSESAGDASEACDRRPAARWAPAGRS